MEYCGLISDDSHRDFFNKQNLLKLVLYSSMSACKLLQWQIIRLILARLCNVLYIYMCLCMVI